MNTKLFNKQKMGKIINNKIKIKIIINIKMMNL